MAMAASTSADSNSDSRFDVFIHHRGPDVKRTLASHLYRRLIGKGLRAFLDIKELKEGKNISDQTQGAIRSASVHIAIFSPRYAESWWCLDDLVSMLESGAPIIPVYYKVSPADLRCTAKGVYGEALEIVERNRAYDSDQSRHDSTRTEKWRNALSQVAGISGLELHAFNGDEGELVDKVVESVLRCLKPEAVESAEEDASTSADSNNDYRCDVFISYRGQEVKKTFASHLYRSLIGNGLQAFLDREELQCGDVLVLEIQAAIRTASIHVAIFSKGYVESAWCLQELMLMLESGAPIIPVYYHVRPFELKRTLGAGTYAASLQQLAEKRDSSGQPRYDSTTIQKWTNALSQVADINGFIREDKGDEGELLDKVVESVLRRAAKTQKGSAAKYLIGLDEKVKDFENKVFSQNHQSAKPQVVGIVGVGGVGKTTLAKELFDRKRLNYSKFCFISNVREKARLGSLNSLQRQLLKSLTGTDALINSIDEGKEALKKHLSPCRVLLIIDDVDQLNQIHALFPVQSNFLSDSLVVITSRDEGVIRSSGVENAAIYELEGLDHQHSRQLFCAYAFNQPNPIEGFGSLVDNFLKPLKGLPLFLIVFGAHLSGNNNRLYWQHQLERLQQIPPGETQEILQIGYDSLDREAKEMFLDTACFFIGQKRDTAIRIWEGSGWHGRSGFVALQYKCLLELDSENNIDMHDHLRDFGRAVAVADASLPLRLLHSTTHIKEQLANGQGRAVRGIKMVLEEDNDDVDALGAIDVSSLELLDTENGILERLLRRPEEHVPRRLIWVRWNKCPTPSLPSWLPMKCLRVLQVSGSKLQTLWEDNSQAPLGLWELEINAPLPNIPESIGQLESLERIVIGKFSSGGQVNLTKLPEGFCRLRLLKELVLTECSKMKSLQDVFSGLGNLQHIDLSFCRNLERLPASFENLRRLRHLNLSDCHDLVRLPDSIGRLWRLQHIDLQGCHHLERLPDSFGDLRDLRHINLSGCHDLQRLPYSFDELRYLQHLDLQACHNLEKLPNSFADLKNLEDINLSNCHNLKSLPESFCYLSNLQHIDLSGCHNLERLPNNFRNLKKLKYFDVEGCANLIIDSVEINEISVNLPLAHRSQLEQLLLEDINSNDPPLMKSVDYSGGFHQEFCQGFERLITSTKNFVKFLRD